MRTVFLAALPLAFAGACNGGETTTASTGATAATESSSGSSGSSGAMTTGAAGSSSGSESGTSGSGSSSSSGATSETSSTGTSGGEEARLDLPPHGAVNDGHFATSQICVECHSNAAAATAMRDDKDRPIAPFDLWQGSMMANSARDPFWWAMVAAETATFPSAKEAIEGECMHCHTPMAAVDGAFHGDDAPVLEWLFAGDERAQFGLDGVACAACHQIQPDGLGTEASFSGHYVIKPEGKIFGPHLAPYTMPMMMHTGFTPTIGQQIVEPSHCGSCHTLKTTALDPQGNPTQHTLIEQGPYLEWRLSDFTTEGAPGPDAATCQDCHVPKTSIDGTPITTRIARRPMGDDFGVQIDVRNPFGRHVMVGGNAIIPLVIRDNAAELNPQASAAALEASAAAARAQLEMMTAEVGAKGAREGDELVVDVSIASFVGHKLPSAFPSRRVWLAVTVTDGRGAVVFRSGGYDDAGKIVDQGGTPLASEAVGGPIQPHFTEITGDTEAQIYESVMADEGAKPAFRLLQGVAYVKDNRLLPKGWKGDDPAAKEIAAVGVGGDADFVGGGDALRYRVVAPAAAGPHKVHVELCYQTLGARFAAELFAIEANAVRAFERMFGEADRKPVIIDSVDVVVP